jgi:hypothetical protein
MEQFEGRSVKEWITSLADDAASNRARAANVLAWICMTTANPPYDEVLDALRARTALGPNREKDHVAVRAMFDARKRVGAARVRRKGARVQRPVDLAAAPDRDLTWLVIERLWDAADIYKDRQTLRSILDLVTPGQCAIYAIWWTQSEVDNGGFHQYFWNSTGIVAPEALAGFRLIGASRLAELLDAAMKVFPGGAPSGDCAERQVALESIGGEPFRPLEDELYELEKEDGLFKLTAAYVRSHPDEFFEPGSDGAR